MPGHVPTIGSLYLDRFFKQKTKKLRLADRAKVMRVVAEPIIGCTLEGLTGAKALGGALATPGPATMSPQTSTVEDDSFFLQ